jgi:hypothetical protein
MKNPFRDLFREKDDLAPQDEIEQLFLQLEQVEPPPSLVENILSTVARLPLPQLLSAAEIEELEEELEKSKGSIIQRTHFPPS